MSEKSTALRLDDIRSIIELCKPDHDKEEMFLRLLIIWLRKVNGEEYREWGPGFFDYGTPVSHLETIYKTATAFEKSVTTDTSGDTGDLYFFVATGLIEEKSGLNIAEIKKTIGRLASATHEAIQEVKNMRPPGRPRSKNTVIHDHYLGLLIDWIESAGGTASISQYGGLPSGTLPELLALLRNIGWLKNQLFFDLSYEQLRKAKTSQRSRASSRG
ncbi:hypothetical protein [Mongoliimonas terrestris]|uniref:hypothetical protein n=1 Tax=Mongoliimonas terrestris TaxID=1709001 RepID=UPI0011151F69|nr:hypothetical protein [Mongoliimonas terrestris]